jgi:tRNA(fMet)-specific endonuclease VapC
MSSYLLDTNHASRLIMQEHPLHQRVLSEIDAGHNFSICVPVLTEVLFGIGILPRATDNLARWAILRPTFICYSAHESDGQLAAELQVACRRRGWQLDTVDALIAAIALRYDQILLTTDRDFQGVVGLRVENWLSLP